MHPAEFYTGIVAELYAPLKSTSFSADPYAAFLDAHGGPGLELGCGDGEPIVELRVRGHDVDGVDSSADMLARCRRAAHAAGVTVALYHQRMEALALPRVYASVFLAGPTITLLPDDTTVVATLAGVRRHLAPGGRVLVPLYVPGRVSEPGAAGGVTEDVDADGAVRRVSVISRNRDDVARTQTTVLRYEHGPRSEDRVWTLHWHTPDGFAELAATAGLRVLDVAAQDGRPGEPGSLWSTLLAAAS